MGNSSSKDSRAAPKHNPARHTNDRSAPAQPSPAPPSVPPPPPAERFQTHIYSTRTPRGSRPDLSFLTLGRDRVEANAAPERPRETKQEREARKAEKERQTRLKERERSVREEGVDGGYLVTLGTYTGLEDFNKGIVRQLQIERRLAPFWKGLDDHSRSWTEAQLVAVARGQPLPAADEVPSEMLRTASEASLNPSASDTDISKLTVPITSRSQSYESGTSARLSASHPAFSISGPASPISPTQSTAQLFRGRAKTLASLATGSKSHSPDLTPQEVKLPKDPSFNGQPVEAYLYKDAAECPICFLYYPPYLNKTRCCDQPICSECFVQIKRPDPHPPEHEQPGQARPPEEESETLVSEVAACPFCVTPEFGVSYDPPPFRRGLAYPQSHHNPLRNPTSAMSSSSSLSGLSGHRRRAASLSANAPQVVTTDRVRPDWAKKLADARAHALRRSAAATALHNAAYVLGSQPDVLGRGNLPSFGRRRRTLFGDSPGASGSGTPRGPDGLPLMISPYSHLIRAGAANRDGDDSGSDVMTERGSSRRTRVDDLEDLMMMEAIRLSLAAEEDRMRRDEKDARKDAKKRAKDEKKEAKNAEKLARKGVTSQPGLYNIGSNDSASTWATTSMARSTSNIGVMGEEVHGKGKAPAQDFAGFHPLSEPTSTLNTEMKESHEGSSSSPQQSDTLAPHTEGSQRYLEESRANLQPSPSAPIPTSAPRHMRQLSTASSVASSFTDAPSSLPINSNISSAAASGLDLPTSGSGTPSHEPMLNFSSLAAVIGNEDKTANEHIEHATGDEDDDHTTTRAEEELKEPSPPATEGNRSRGDSGESSASAPPPIYVEMDGDADMITPAPVLVRGEDDKKDLGQVDVWDRGHGREATQ